MAVQVPLVFCEICQTVHALGQTPGLNENLVFVSSHCEGWQAANPEAPGPEAMTVWTELVVVLLVL
jgi:hypothetical protein